MFMNVYKAIKYHCLLVLKMLIVYLLCLKRLIIIIADDKSAIATP